MMKKLKQGGGMMMMDDRISELPDFILHRILSFLEPKAATSAAVLSKLWWTVWLTYPILTFDFYSVATQIFHQSFLDFEKKLREFEKFVEITILRFSTSQLRVHTVRLIPYGSRFDSLMEKSIRVAVEKDVKILQIHPRQLTERWLYSLPEIILSAKSLIKIELRFCSFDKMNLSRHAKIEFNKLKKVVFYEIDHLHNWVFDKLICNCPLIEEVEMYQCNLSFKRLRVNSVPNLKRFEMKYCSNGKTELEMVEIDAPSLESLLLYDSLEGVLNFDACRNLKRLELITQKHKHSESFSISNFPFLEILELKVGSLCKRGKLNISSQSLKRVCLQKHGRFDEVMIDAPNLLEFIVSLRMYITVNEDSFTWFLNLRKLLMKHSNETKVFLSLDVHAFKSCFEIKDSEELPKAEVEHLTLCLYCSRPTNYQALVDGLFWSFHPSYMSFRWSSRDKPDPEFIECLWENVMNRAGIKLSCCNHQQIKCWRHYLEDAKVESFNGTVHDAYSTPEEVLKSAEEGKRFCFRLKWHAPVVDLIIC